MRYKELPKLTIAQWKWLLKNYDSPEFNELGYTNHWYFNNRRMANTLSEAGLIHLDSACCATISSTGRDVAEQLIDLAGKDKSIPERLRIVLASYAPNSLLDDPSDRVVAVALEHCETIDREHAARYVNADEHVRELVIDRLPVDDLDLFDSETSLNNILKLECRNPGWIIRHKQHLFDAQLPGAHQVLASQKNVDSDMVHALAVAGLADYDLWRVHGFSAKDGVARLADVDIRTMLERGNPTFVSAFLNASKEYGRQDEYVTPELIDHWVRSGSPKLIDAVLTDAVITQKGVPFTVEQIGTLAERGDCNFQLTSLPERYTEAQLNELLEKCDGRSADGVYRNMPSSHRWTDRQLELLDEKTGRDSWFQYQLRAMAGKLYEKFENPEGEVVRKLVHSALAAWLAE